MLSGFPLVYVNRINTAAVLLKMSNYVRKDDLTRRLIRVFTQRFVFIVLAAVTDHSGISDLRDRFHRGDEQQ